MLDSYVHIFATHYSKKCNVAVVLAELNACPVFLLELKICIIVSSPQAECGPKSVSKWEP